MHFLIIEDNREDQNELKDLFKEYEKSRKIKINLNFISSWSEIDTMDNYDAIFSDIELDNENGIEYARRFRIINKTTCLVFISAYQKYLLDGYKAAANLYMLKPIEQHYFNNELDSLIFNYLYQKKAYYNSKIYSKPIYYKDILYIEKLQRRSIVHLVEGTTITCFFTLKKWLEILNSPLFVQSHRAFLVNLQHVSNYELNYVEVGDIQIPITDIFKSSFKKSYFSYMERMMLQ